MPNREQVLQIVKQKGPVIPNQIKKEVGGDTFIVGAILSELVNEGLVKVSSLKIGGSPTYYVSGQEYRLLNLKKYLNEKDQRTIDLLKESKVLRDTDQDMLIRVSLRNIKDFAKQLEVNVKGQKEMFWKWYATPKEEVEEIIKKHLGIEKPKQEEQKEETKRTAEEHKAEPKKERQETIFRPEKPKQEEKRKTEEKRTTTEKTEPEDDDFSKKIHAYFREKRIRILEEKVIRKNSEIDLRVIIPTAVGDAEYFCKTKNKKKCGDGDLSSAYLKGQVLKMPVLFITTGEVTKKALSMLNEEFKGMTLKQI